MTKRKAMPTLVKAMDNLYSILDDNKVEMSVDVIVKLEEAFNLMDEAREAL